MCNSNRKPVWGWFVKERLLRTYLANCADEKVCGNCNSERRRGNCKYENKCRLLFPLRKRQILIMKKSSNRRDILHHLPVPHTLFAAFAMRKADARKQEVSPDVNEERASGLDRSDVRIGRLRRCWEKRKSPGHLEEKPPTHFLIYYTACKKTDGFFQSRFVPLNL